MDKQEYNILLEQLSLENFRCFKELTLSFEEQLTVIIAENGGGKTAILEAIAGSLKNYLAQLKVKGYKLARIPEKDISIGAVGGSHSYLTADVDFSKREKYEDKGEKVVDFVPYNELATFDYSSSNEDTITSEFRNEAVTFKDLSLGNTSIPVLVYFGGESVKVEYNPKLTSSPDKLQLVYQSALEGDRLAYTHFYNWWKLNEDKMLRMKRGSAARNTMANQFLKIQTAVEHLMNDDPEQPTYKNLRINEDLKMGMDKITYDNGKQVKGDFIEVSQFSAGEKSLFAYVADLGLRLLHANPLETSAEDVGLHVFKGNGVALIDEIGLHLHPKWQQRVIKKLLDIFPEVQFVVTTHSLEVLKGLERSNLRIIRNGNILSDVPYIKGRDNNSILQDAFHLNERPLKYEEDLASFYRYVDSDNEEDRKRARTILDKLKKDWGDADEEIQRAESYYEIF